MKFMNKIIIDTVNILDNEEVMLNELKSNKFNIGKNSKLIINVNESNFSDYEFNLSDDAYLEINKFYNDNGIDEDINIKLNGINSKVTYNFSVLTSKSLNYTISVMHNNKNTTSKIVNHGVVLNDSSLTFDVYGIVEKGNAKSVLDQENRIIVMGKNNSVIKPKLFIDEFDVEARHAATIGKFSEDEIFYLMTKGIDKYSANELLINGFLKNNLNGGE